MKCHGGHDLRQIAIANPNKANVVCAAISQFRWVYWTGHYELHGAKSNALFAIAIIAYSYIDTAVQG